MTPKIHRPAGDIDFFSPDDAEIRLSHALPHPLDGYEVRFGRSRWWTIDEFMEDGETPDRLRQRTTRGRISFQGKGVGAVLLKEYDIPPIPGEWLWESMDGYSSATHELAETLLRAWPEFTFEVGCYGAVLEINRVWVERGHATPGIWIPVVRELANRIRRQIAVVMAKAFPVEYEGKLPPEAPELHAFERRRRAMMRYYGRHLGLGPLPGRSGEDGWLWKPRDGLEDLVAPPGFYEDWRGIR